MLTNYMTISGHAKEIKLFFDKYNQKFEIIYNKLPEDYDVKSDYNGNYEIFLKNESDTKNEYYNLVSELSNKYKQLHFDTVSFDKTRNIYSTYMMSNEQIIESSAFFAKNLQEYINSYLDFTMARFEKN